MRIGSFKLTAAIGLGFCVAGCVGFAEAPDPRGATLSVEVLKNNTCSITMLGPEATLSFNLGPKGVTYVTKSNDLRIKPVTFQMNNAGEIWFMGRRVSPDLGQDVLEPAIKTIRIISDEIAAEAYKRCLCDVPLSQDRSRELTRQFVRADLQLQAALRSLSGQPRP